jgi:hypothetical protein
VLFITIWVLVLGRLTLQATRSDAGAKPLRGVCGYLY